MAPARPLLSRVADSLYWMARYIERAENVARFVGVNLHLMLDLPSYEEKQWQPIVDTTGDANIFLERYGKATQDSVIEFLKSLQVLPPGTKHLVVDEHGKPKKWPPKG